MWDGWNGIGTDIGVEGGHEMIMGKEWERVEREREIEIEKEAPSATHYSLTIYLYDDFPFCCSHLLRFLEPEPEPKQRVVNITHDHSRRCRI